MDLQNKICAEIDQDINFYEEYLKNEIANKTFKKAEELLNVMKEKGKKSLLESPIFDIYVTTCALLNESLAYDEVKTFLKPMKNSINRWSVEDIATMREINNEYIAVDEHGEGKYIKKIETLNKCYGLGFTKEILKNEVILAFSIIVPLLEFKDKVKQGMSLDNENYFLTQKRIDSLFSSLPINLISETVERYVIQSRNVQKEKTRDITRKKENLKRFKEELQENIHQDMSELPSYTEGCLSDHSLEYVYELCHLNLQKENKTLDKEIAIIERMLSNPIIRILYENNVNPDTIEDKNIEILSKINFEKVEKSIRVFAEIGLPIAEILNREENIIQKVDLSSLETIKFFCLNGILKKETVKEHLSIFTQDAKRVITNYEIIKSIMEFQNNYYEDKILLLDPKELQQRLSVLAEYSLTKNDYIFLLCHYEYIGIYDLILEQNIPRYLFIKICMTDNPILTIKRICLYMILDIPYQTATNLLKKDVKEERHFLCNDESLDEYLSLIECKEEKGIYIGDIKKTPIVKQLDEEYRIDDVYCFNNTICSRPKFLRNLQSRKDNNEKLEDNIQNCLLSQSIVNQKNILEIKKEMKKM